MIVIQNGYQQEMQNHFKELAMLSGLRALPETRVLTRRKSGRPRDASQPVDLAVRPIWFLEQAGSECGDGHLPGTEPAFPLLKPSMAVP